MRTTNKTTAASNTVVNAKIVGIRPTREFNDIYYVIKFDQQFLHGAIENNVAPAPTNVIRFKKARLLAIICQHIAYADRMLADYTDRKIAFGIDELSAILIGADVTLNTEEIAAGEQRIIDGKTYDYKYDQYVTTIAGIDTTDDVAETLYANYGQTKSLADILKANRK